MLLNHKIRFTLYEADRSNPDCLRIYGKATNCKLAVFSERQKYEDAANRLYEQAIANLTLVNLPAQVLPALKRWIEENDILTLSAEGLSRTGDSVASYRADKHRIVIGRRSRSLVPIVLTIFVVLISGFLWRGQQQAQTLQWLLRVITAECANGVESSNPACSGL